jgi:transposase
VCQEGANIRYRVDLSDVERTQLTALLSGGKHAARKIKRAQILLAADAGVSDDVVASSLSVSGSTVYRTKRRFVQGSLELALSEEARPGATRKLSGKETALLIATACSSPPEGRKRWTLDLLVGVMVRLTDHEGVSRETVRRRLAEDDLKPWRRDMWCIPQVDGTYVARMEDVLDLYAEEADPCGARPWSAAHGAGSAELAVPADQPHRSQPARTLPSHARSRPPARQAAGRPQPAVVCWPDHNGAGCSATMMVDTIPVPSRRNILCAVNCALTLLPRHYDRARGTPGGPACQPA